MSQNPKIFKVHLTISRKPKGIIKYGSVPVPLLIFAKNAASAEIVAEEHVQEFLAKQEAYIKAKKVTEIKVLDVLTDEKNKL